MSTTPSSDDTFEDVLRQILSNSGLTDAQVDELIKKAKELERSDLPVTLQWLAVKALAERMYADNQQH